MKNIFIKLLFKWLNINIYIYFKYTQYTLQKRMQKTFKLAYKV